MENNRENRENSLYWPKDIKNVICLEKIVLNKDKLK